MFDGYSSINTVHGMERLPSLVNLKKNEKGKAADLSTSINKNQFKKYGKPVATESDALAKSIDFVNRQNLNKLEAEEKKLQREILQATQEGKAEAEEQARINLVQNEKAQALQNLSIQLNKLLVKQITDETNTFITNMQQVLKQDPDQLIQFRRKASRSVKNKPAKIELLVDLAKFLPTGDSIKSVIGNKVQDIAHLKKPKQAETDEYIEGEAEDYATRRPSDAQIYGYGDYDYYQDEYSDDEPQSGGYSSRFETKPKRMTTLFEKGREALFKGFATTRAQIEPTPIEPIPIPQMQIDTSQFQNFHES
jgi:hypothetical protein